MRRWSLYIRTQGGSNKRYDGEAENADETYIPARQPVAVETLRAHAHTSDSAASSLDRLAEGVAHGEALNCFAGGRRATGRRGVRCDLLRDRRHSVDESGRPWGGKI